MPSRRRAFTLVELLVVIGIIALLVAILMPVLGKAREQANRVKCAAHLHSIGYALVAYTQHYGRYPGCEGGRNGSQVAIWPVRLRAFLGGDQGVFYCPSQDERCRWEKALAGPAPLAGADQAVFGYEVGERTIDWRTYFSYGYNWSGASFKNRSGIGQVRDGTHRGLGMWIDPRGEAYVDPHGGGSSISGHLPAGRVKTPSEMIAVTDSTADGNFDYAVNPHFDFKTFQWPGKVHNGGPNVLFCDGHVQWYLQRELTLEAGERYEPRAIQLRRLWNNNHEPD